MCSAVLLKLLLQCLTASWPYWTFWSLPSKTWQTARNISVTRRPHRTPLHFNSSLYILLPPRYAILIARKEIKMAPHAGFLQTRCVWYWGKQYWARESLGLWCRHGSNTTNFLSVTGLLEVPNCNAKLIEASIINALWYICLNTSQYYYDTRDLTFVYFSHFMPKSCSVSCKNNPMIQCTHVVVTA